MRLSHNDGLVVQTRHDGISFPHSSLTWHLYAVSFVMSSRWVCYANIDHEFLTGIWFPLPDIPVFHDRPDR